MLKETLRIVGLVSFYFAGLFAIGSLGGCEIVKTYAEPLQHFGYCVATCAGAGIAEAVKVRAVKAAATPPADPAPVVPGAVAK